MYNPGCPGREDGILVIPVPTYRREEFLSLGHALDEKAWQTDIKLMKANDPTRLAFISQQGLGPHPKTDFDDYHPYYPPPSQMLAVFKSPARAKVPVILTEIGGLGDPRGKFLNDNWDAIWAYDGVTGMRLAGGGGAVTAPASAGGCLNSGVRTLRGASTTPVVLKSKISQRSPWTDSHARV